jgi:hypothetical protein
MAVKTMFRKNRANIVGEINLRKEITPDESDK